MEKDKVVYIHRRKDTGEPFYVGEGSKERPYNKKNRGKEWNRIVKATGGYDIDIVAEELTKFEAWDLERELVTKYGRLDLGTGILVNQTGGGGGTIEVSDDTREKLSKKSKERWNNENYRNNITKHICDRWMDNDFKKNHKDKIKNKWKNSQYRQKNSIKKKKNNRGKGINFSKRLEKYRVIINIDSEAIFLGDYNTYEEALRVRLEAEEKYWGIPLDTPLLTINTHLDKLKSTPQNPELKEKILKERRLKNRGKGICFNKKENRYYVKLYDGKLCYASTFKTYKQALQARLEAEEKYWGIPLDTPVPIDNSHIDKMIALKQDPSQRKLSLEVNKQKEIERKRKNKRGKGIYFNKKENRYNVNIYFNGKLKYIGRYETYKEALQARLEAEEKYWGVSLDTPVP